MRFNPLLLRLGKVALSLAICVASISAHDPTNKKLGHRADDPCRDSAQRPVLLYDANTRTASIRFRDEVLGFPQDAYGSIRVPPPPSPGDPEQTFLCDGRPAEVWIANRRLKQVFSVTTTSVFVLSSGLPELREMPSAPAVALPTAAPAAAPTAKGGLAGPTTLTTDVVVGYLLNEETFDRPLQRLRADAANVTEQHRFLATLFSQYKDTLDRFTDVNPPSPPPPPLVPPPEVQGTVTLRGTTANFLRETISVKDCFPIPALQGVHLEQPEFSFDQLTGQTNLIVADVQRINAKLQSYPIVDVLVNLRSQVDTYEDSLRILDHEYQNIDSAITILQDLQTLANKQKENAKKYLRERNAAEIRVILTQRYGVSPAALDASTIARIVNLYMENQGKETSAFIDGSGIHSLNSRLDSLHHTLNYFSVSSRVALDMPCKVMTTAGAQECHPGYDAPPPNDTRPCNTLNPVAPCVKIDGFPDWGTADPFQGKLNAANNKLDTLRQAIRDLNSAEAETFAAINAVYDTYRAPPIPLNLDLQGNSGNLIVFYSIKGNEQFQRYQVTNESQQPQSACVQALAAGNGTTPGTPNCATTAPGTAPPAATTAVVTAAAPATTASTTTPPNPPADFYGRFEVHHFVRGALVTGFAFDSIGNRSYSWVACPVSPPAPPSGACFSAAPTSGTAPTTATYQLVQSNSPQAAVVVGVTIFIKREDMFPGAKSKWWQRSGPFLGASAYPLNHYFLGCSLEPLHGLNLTLGPVFGSQTRLPNNYTQGPVTAATAPTIPSSSGFRAGVFVMVGFDTSMFKAIFGSLWGNVTSVGAAAPTSTGSK